MFHKSGLRSPAGTRTNTKNFFQKAAPRIKMEGIGQLKIIEEKELPRLEVMTVYLSNPINRTKKSRKESESKIEGLRNEDWKVLRRKDKITPNTNFSVNNTFAEYLGKRCLQTNCFFGLVHFRESSINKATRPNSDKDPKGIQMCRKCNINIEI